MEGTKWVLHKEHFVLPFVAIQSEIKNLSWLHRPAQSSADGGGETMKKADLLLEAP